MNIDSFNLDSIAALEALLGQWMKCPDGVNRCPVAVDRKIPAFSMMVRSFEDGSHLLVSNVALVPKGQEHNMVYWHNQILHGELIRPTLDLAGNPLTLSTIPSP